MPPKHEEHNQSYKSTSQITYLLLTEALEGSQTVMRKPQSKGWQAKCPQDEPERMPTYLPSSSRTGIPQKPTSRPHLAVTWHAHTIACSSDTLPRVPLFHQDRGKVLSRPDLCKRGHRPNSTQEPPSSKQTGL